MTHLYDCAVQHAPLAYRFTGKERDTESGLDNFGARYDSSQFGRFMSPDPFLSSGRPANPRSWNRYTYALNKPLRILDPTGLYVWDESAGGDFTDDELLEARRYRMTSNLPLRLGSTPTAQKATQTVSRLDTRMAAVPEPLTQATT